MAPLVPKDAGNNKTGLAGKSHLKSFLQYDQGLADLRIKTPLAWSCQGPWSTTAPAADVDSAMETNVGRRKSGLNHVLFTEFHNFYSTGIHCIYGAHMCISPENIVAHKRVLTLLHWWTCL